ncbi:MAG: CsgG/HfaB family protein [Elainellaceae cyanobacterium]
MKGMKFLSLGVLSLGAALVVGAGLPIVSSWLGTAPVFAQEAERKRVVVLDFDFAETSNSGYWYSYRGRGAARGISEMIVSQLVNDGSFSVVDSSQVGQDRWYGVSVSEAVAVGRELGVDAIVMGTVTRFDVSEDQVCVRIAFVRTCNEETLANVQINARLINTASGEVVATAEGEGQVSANDASGSLSGVGSGSSNNSRDDALLSEAVETAVTQITEEMIDRADRL